MHRLIERKLKLRRWSAVLALPYYMLFSLPVFYLGAALAIAVADRPYFGFLSSLLIIPFLWVYALVSPIAFVGGLEFLNLTTNLGFPVIIGMGFLYIAPSLSVIVPSLYAFATRRLAYGSRIALTCLPMSLMSGYLNGVHNPAGLI